MAGTVFRSAAMPRRHRRNPLPFRCTGMSIPPRLPVGGRAGSAARGATCTGRWRGDRRRCGLLRAAVMPDRGDQYRENRRALHRLVGSVATKRPPGSPIRAFGPARARGRAARSQERGAGDLRPAIRPPAIRPRDRSLVIKALISRRFFSGQWPLPDDGGGAAERWGAAERLLGDG